MSQEKIATNTNNTQNDVLQSPKRDQSVPHVDYGEGLHSILFDAEKEESAFHSEAKRIYQNSLYRVSAYVFSINVIVLISISILLDFHEKNYSILVPLSSMCIPAVFALLWLQNEKRNPAVPLLILGCSATLLCGYVLIAEGSPDGSSMLWIAIFPSTIVLYMGLRYGTAAFILFYAFLIGLFFTPMGSVMSVQLTDSMELRLLIVCFGSFIFVWCLEFARFKTTLALHSVAYRIEQSALTDSLTGLGNRRDFDRSLAWTMGRAERNNTTFSLCIIDIDHFKKVNDTYGHAVGDQVLAHIAKEVETQIRNADCLFRWGGEEFAIVMPTTTLDKAVAGSERIRKHIEKTPFMLKNEQVYLTISIGIYSGTETKDAQHVLRVADQCLYKAKSTGRNKVVGSI